jgi:flagellar biosynthesis GTPase FlhF
MAHKFAYEYYLRYRPKAFVIYQPHKEASRGNYGVKGESDEEVTEAKSDAIEKTVYDLQNPPKVMQHRAKRDMERDEQLKGRDIAKRDDDDFFPGDTESQQLMRYVQQHYPNASTKQQAFIKFAQRALQHSKEEDEMQDKEIASLKQEVGKLKKDHEQITKVSESADYLDEK